MAMRSVCIFASIFKMSISIRSNKKEIRYPEPSIDHAYILSPYQNFIPKIIIILYCVFS